MGWLDSEEDHETTLEQLCARIRKRKNTSIRSRANKGKMPMRDEDILESENDMDSESENDMDSPTYVESGDRSSNDDENLATFDNETTAQEKDIQIRQGGSHLWQGKKKRKCNMRTKNVKDLMHQT